MKALTLIASLGAIQGVIILLSILLKFRHRKNLPLALLLIVFSVRLATIPTWDPDILLKYQWIYPLTAPLPFLFGPLLWMYIKELGSDKLKNCKSCVFHFIPYFLETAALIITLTAMTATEYRIFISNVFSGNPPLWLPVRNGLKVAVNIVYVILSAKTAFGAESKKMAKAKRCCMKALVVLPSVVLIAFAYVALPPSVTHDLAGGAVLPFFILTVAMAVLIYGISFILMIVPEISFFTISGKTGTAEKLCSDRECEKLVELVSIRFAEGAFHNPDLVLTDLASEFNVHPNRLSFAVNHCCGVSFRSFLNRKRIDFFTSQISRGAHKNSSILEIAFEAGFPSKSTFNRVFKEETGMTPSEYVGSIDKGKKGQGISS